MMPKEGEKMNSLKILTNWHPNPTLLVKATYCYHYRKQMVQLSNNHLDHGQNYVNKYSEARSLYKRGLAF